ncbi:unnamed protein product [Soboliphyme baturini]|uniref:PEROXIDASE_4 domain-containing protein n=1 Tax=Soboliphyme baturini TaxID=241478 RepID=A0A183IMJ9_9BILA|nr:unnamed protein product [Soboliphyme baturini]
MVRHFVLGCLPYVDQIGQAVWALCKTRANAKTGSTLSGRIMKLLSGSGIDLKGALKEMCETSVQKETCDKLGGHLTKCDVFGGIAALIAYRQAIERCSMLLTSLEQPQNLPANIGGFLTKFYTCYN